MPWDVLVNYSTVFPDYYNLERAFDDYRQNSRPAGPYPKNQCAIRMSVALGRCGFSLSAFAHPARLKTIPEIPVPYVMGAQELAQYLQKIWGTRLIYRHNLATVCNKLNGKRGIIYFNNCFHRKEEPEGTKQGDHIDLWNGKTYYNRLYNIPAGMEDRRSSGPLFEVSDQVWFFELA